MKNSFWNKGYLVPIYYILLYAILLVYPSSSTIVQWAYLAALLAPTIKTPEYLPAVIVAFIGTSHYTSEDVPLILLNNRSIYLFIALLMTLWQIIQKKTKPLNPIFIFLIIYVILVDIINDGEISEMALWGIFAILLFTIASSDFKKANTYLFYSFILLSTGVSYLILTNLANLEVQHLEGSVDRYVWWNDPNYVGTVISIGLTVIAVNIFQNKPRPLSLLVYTLLLLLFIDAILILGSRGALLSSLVPIAILLIFEVFAAKSRKIKILTVISFAVIGSAVVYVIISNNWFELMQYRIDEGMGTGGGRTIIWKDKLNTFLDEGSIIEYLFGYGHNGGYSLGILKRNDAFHNDYVAFLVMYGIVGICFFIYTLLYPILRVNKKNLPIVLALLSNIVTTALSLEPFTSHYFVYIAFYMAILIRAKSDKI